jgi:hypothetical protein
MEPIGMAWLTVAVPLSRLGVTVYLVNGRRVKDLRRYYKRHASSDRISARVLAKLPFNGRDRNIGEVPGYVTGPASRACGACHRTEMINEDAAGELIPFNQHTKQGGYLIEGGEDEGAVLLAVIDEIMALFGQ